MESKGGKLRLVYVGRRMTVKNKMGAFWMAEGDERLRGYTKPLCLASIGETWEFATNEDGSIDLKVEPVMIAGAHKHTLRFAAEEVAAEQAYRELLAERKHKNKETIFERNMRPLKAMAAGLNSYELTHFVHAVTVELYRRDR